MQPRWINEKVRKGVDMEITHAKGSSFTRPFRRAAEAVSRPFLRIRNVQMRAAVITLVLGIIIWSAAWCILGLFPLSDQSLCTNDGYAQYMPFLSEFWSVFREGGSPLYTFHGGLGGNFFLTIAYYLMSPFSFVALLFDRTQIPAAANLIIILKNIFVCVLMAWYLPSRNKATRAMPAVACAMCYGLGYYFMGYAVNFMWMDSIALVPVMLYGMERIDTRKGRAIYLFSLAAAIFMNFYMGAIICLFLALYEVVILMKVRHGEWKNVLWFAICSICAAMIAGTVLLPVVEGMLMDNVSRMSPPEFEVFNGFGYFFSRLLPDADIVRITHNRGAINLYMGVACLFLCLVYIARPKTSWRIKLGLAGLCLLYLVSTQISWLNYAFHGFYMQRQVPNRFGFLVAFLACLMMYEGLIYIRKTRLVVIIGSALLSAIFFCGALAVSNTDKPWIAALLCAVILVDALAAGIKNQTLLAWLMVFESCGFLVQSAPGTLSDSFTNMKPYLEAASFTGEGRSDVLTCDIVNAPALYGFKGISNFNSVINPDTASILGRMGFASGENYYRIFGHTPLSDMLLGVDLLAAKEGELVAPPFVEVAKVDDVVIWKSPYATPIGTTILGEATPMASKNKFENLNELFPDSFKILDIKTTVSAPHEFEENDNGGYTLKDIKDGNETRVMLYPIEAKNLYVYGRLSGTGRYEVLKNGQTVHKDKYEGDIVYVGDVVKEDEIEIVFEADADRDQQDLRLQFATLDPEASKAAAQMLIDRGLKDQQVSDTVVTGTYDCETPVKMVFTIPYDIGWSAMVNGQKVPLESYLDGFIQIPLEAGHNEIRLTYKPVGLDAGCMLSMEGLVLSGAILLFPLPKRKKKGGSKEDSDDDASKAATSAEPETDLPFEADEDAQEDKTEDPEGMNSVESMEITLPVSISSHVDEQILVPEGFASAQTEASLPGAIDRIEENGREESDEVCATENASADPTPAADEANSENAPAKSGAAQDEAVNESCSTVSAPDEAAAQTDRADANAAFEKEAEPSHDEADLEETFLEIAKEPAKREHPAAAADASVQENDEPSAEVILSASDDEHHPSAPDRSSRFDLTSESEPTIDLNEPVQIETDADKADDEKTPVADEQDVLMVYMDEQCEETPVEQSEDDEDWLEEVDPLMAQKMAEKFLSQPVHHRVRYQKRSVRRRMEGRIELSPSSERSNEQKD